MSPYNDLSIIGRFIQATAQPCNADKVLQTLADILSEQPRIVGLATYTRVDDRFVLKQSYGLAAQRKQTLAAWNGLAAGDDITEALLSYLESAEIDAIAECTPLIGDEQPIGALCLFTNSATPFDSHEVQFLDTLGKVVGVTLHNAHLYAVAQDSRQQIKQVTQRLLLSQELERERISNELHRNAVQELVGIKIHLGMLSEERDLPHSDLTTSINLCDSVLDRLSLLALALRPVMLHDLGLDTALHSFCREITARSNAVVTYSGAPDVLIENDTAGVAFYRFLQESLSTVQSGRVYVHLTADFDTIQLSILWEEGKVQHEPERISLTGMRERIEAVGGVLMEEEDDAGYRLTALIRL